MTGCSGRMACRFYGDHMSRRLLVERRLQMDLRAEMGTTSARGDGSQRRLPGRFTQIYSTATVGLLALAIGSAAVLWVAGEDPATESMSESESLRNELKPLRQVPIGDFVYLNSSSHHRWLLGPGFALAEDDGTWVRAREAEIVFYPEPDVESEGGDLKVELSMSPLLVGDATSRSVTVSSSAETVSVSLPAGGARVNLALTSAEEQIIRIRCDDLDAPTSAMEITDLRRLCVKVYALAVRVGDAK